MRVLPLSQTLTVSLNFRVFLRIPFSDVFYLPVGVTVDIADIRKESDALLLATGATWPRDLKIANRNLDGIHFGTLRFLALCLEWWLTLYFSYQLWSS